MHVGTQYAHRGVPSLLDSVIMFCHMYNIAYMLCACVCICVYTGMCVLCMCMYVCVCVCVYMQVLCSRMVKVHLHNVYWCTCI